MYSTTNAFDQFELGSYTPNALGYRINKTTKFKITKKSFDDTKKPKVIIGIGTTELYEIH